MHLGRISAIHAGNWCCAWHLVKKKQRKITKSKQYSNYNENKKVNREITVNGMSDNMSDNNTGLRQLFQLIAIIYFSFTLTLIILLNAKL